MDTVGPTAEVSPAESCLLVLSDATSAVDLGSMRESTEIDHTIQLASRQALTVPRPRSGMWLVCVRGYLWITLPGDPADYLLGEGERRFLPPCPGIVVSAIGPSEARFVPDRRGSLVIRPRGDRAASGPAAACADC